MSSVPGQVTAGPLCADDQDQESELIEDVPAALTLLIVGFALLGRGVLLRSSLSKAREWLTTVGTVMQSEVRRESNGIWTTDIVYLYTANGVEYESEIVNLDGELRIGFSDKPARRRVAKYPNGSSVLVHYNPKDPSMSFLETAPSAASRYRLIVGGVLAGAGIIFLARAFGIL